MNERCQSGCILLIDHADIWPALIFFMRQAPCERVFLLRQLILSHEFSCRLILSQELKERIFRSVSLLQTGCVIYGWTFRAPLLSRSKWNKNIQKKMSVLFAESFSCSLFLFVMTCIMTFSLQKSNSFLFVLPILTFPFLTICFLPRTTAIGFISFLSCYLFFLVSLFSFLLTSSPLSPFYLSLPPLLH